MKAALIITANQSVMNSEHTISRGHRSRGVGWIVVLIAVISGIGASTEIALSSAGGSNYSHAVQAAGGSVDTDFASSVSAMSNTEPGDAAGIEKLEKKALGILDGLVISGLAGNGPTDLESLNTRLAGLGSQERAFGEAYRVTRLGGKPVVFALVADFGLGAPSAVRIYAQQVSSGSVALVGQIDRFSQQDMFDDSLELLPVLLPETATDVVFVTVGGRTDKLQTGIFTAWRFDGKKLTQLWTSDLISHSTFEMSAGTLVLTYCHDPAEQDSKTCKSMVREKYSYSDADGKWRQVSTESAANPKQSF
jgi:hypothetical protein